jgi:hypothetical protein
MAKSLSRAALVASILLYCAALAFPGFYVTQGNELPKPGIDGRWILFFGPFALFQGIVTWLANPVLFVSWIATVIQKQSAALVFSLMALGLGLSFFFYHGSKFHDGSQINTIGYPALGYWLWITSIVTAVFAVLWARCVHSNKTMLKSGC